jgi:hypothetical protein
MMIRKAITAVLLLFVASSIGFLVASETRTTTDGVATVPPRYAPTSIPGAGSKP